MALGACRECGGKVSSEAATCPHCGVATPYTPPSTVVAAAPQAAVDRFAVKPMTPRQINVTIVGAFGLLGVAALTAGWVHLQGERVAREQREQQTRNAAEMGSKRKAAEAREDEERLTAARAARAAADLRANMSPRVGSGASVSCWAVDHQAAASRRRRSTDPEKSLVATSRSNFSPQPFPSLRSLWTCGLLVPSASAIPW